jgi:hypothetical protein
MKPDMKPEGGDAYDQPLRIEAHNGEVVITSGAASVALTARAAAASADLLAGAAKLALAQSPASEAQPVKSANGG